MDFNVDTDRNDREAIEIWVATSSNSQRPTPNNGKNSRRYQHYTQRRKRQSHIHEYRAADKNGKYKTNFHLSD